MELARHIEYCYAQSVANIQWYMTKGLYLSNDANEACVVTRFEYMIKQ